MTTTKRQQGESPIEDLHAPKERLEPVWAGSGWEGWGRSSSVASLVSGIIFQSHYLPNAGYFSILSILIFYQDLYS